VAKKAEMTDPNRDSAATIANRKIFERPGFVFDGRANSVQFRDFAPSVSTAHSKERSF
jgi:hypothetical protein